MNTNNKPDGQAIPDVSRLSISGEGHLLALNTLPSTITFDSRDALLKELCLRVFGANPIYKDEI